MTITRSVFSRVILSCAVKSCVICAVGVESRSLRSLLRFSLFHSSVEICSHYSPASVDPIVTCQRFLLRPALRTWNRLTLMDNPSSLCAQHAIWCAILTDRGMEGQFAIAVFQSTQCGETFIKSCVPFFLSACHIICTALSGALWSWSCFISKTCTTRSHDWCREWVDY